MKKIKVGKFYINRLWAFVAGGVVLFILIAWLAFYLSKDWVMQKAVTKIQGKLRNDYGLTLTFDDYKLKGWSVVEMDGITAITPLNDTLARLEHVKVDIKLMPLISGSIRLNEVLAEQGVIDATYIKDLKTEEAEEDLPDETTDTTAFARIKKYLSYLEMASNMIPDLYVAKDIRLKYRDSVDNINALLQEMKYKDEEFEAAALVAMRGKQQRWKANGSFDRSSLETHANIATQDTTFFSFNFIKQIAQADVGLSELTFDLDDYKNKKNEVALKGSIVAKRAFIYNPRLAKDTILVQYGGMAFSMEMNENKITVEDGKLILNEISAPFEAYYEYSPVGDMEVNLEMPAMDANKFLSSLPIGMFEHVKGMQMKGELSYKLDFFVDFAEKDSIHIDSDMDGKGLKIVRYSKARLDKLNSAFNYIPYNSDEAIIVGPENPDFVPVDQVSPFLKQALLVSEDPSFFRHRGFVEEAIEQSFLENLQEERFKRGGSTISMQLVKNVFLSHEKTMERKLEEIFIVWLIENMRLSSKERMFEVYLNVIEWGPGVYGIGEASRFYFNKHPANLSLNESIFLANIVPRPRAFAWKFDDYGNLREYARSGMQFISNVMLRRGMISEGDHVMFTPDVYISGPARGYMKIKPAPEPEDTMNIENEIRRWRIDLDKLFNFDKEERLERREERQEDRRRRRQERDSLRSSL